MTSVEDASIKREALNHAVAIAVAVGSAGNATIRAVDVAAMAATFEKYLKSEA